MQSGTFDEHSVFPIPSAINPCALAKNYVHALHKTIYMRGIKPCACACLSTCQGRGESRYRQDDNKFQHPGNKTV